MSPTRSHTGPWTEIRPGARAHHTHPSNRAHAPPTTQPHQPGRPRLPSVPAQIREGPSVAPRPAEARGCPLAGAALSLSGPMRQRTAADRVWDNRLRTRVFGALPSMKRLQGCGARRTKVGSDAKRAKLWPSPGDAPSWEDSARRPDFSECPEGVWDSRGRDGSTTRPRRSGRVADAADGPQPPLVASLLPLAVRAGALAFAGLAVRRVGRDSGRGPAAAVRARPERVRAPPRPALPTAMRHDTGLAPTLGVASR
jgi:hypothetical protein